VAQVIYVDEALLDLERLFNFVAEQDLEAATTAVQHIREAVELLERHPLIGRLAEHGLRELVISYGKSGYVVLYEFLEAEDVVLVLALRHQREAGYPGSTPGL
jgi:addiction module RelE/StbE family toxin